MSQRCEFARQVGRQQTPSLEYGPASNEGRGKNPLDECNTEAAFVTPDNLTASIEVCVWYAQGKRRWY
jgi:hypothetical protein